MAACAAEKPVVIPPATFDSPKAAGPLQTAVLAGGCFWGIQAVFEHLSGVKRVVAGYAGGDKSTAEYETVSTGQTGHAESIENRQGPDHGTQYRSAIFYRDETQKKIAMDYIAQLEGAKVYRAPIVTRVDPYKGFFAAEEYHQDFLLKNPNHPYIVINDVPKIQNFRTTLPALYRGSP